VPPTAAPNTPNTPSAPLVDTAKLGEAPVRPTVDLAGWDAPPVRAGQMPGAPMPALAAPSFLSKMTDNPTATPKQIETVAGGNAADVNSPSALITASYSKESAAEAPLLDRIKANSDDRTLTHRSRIGSILSGLGHGALSGLQRWDGQGGLAGLLGAAAGGGVSTGIRGAVDTTLSDRMGRQRAIAKDSTALQRIAAMSAAERQPWEQQAAILAKQADERLKTQKTQAEINHLGAQTSSLNNPLPEIKPVGDGYGIINRDGTTTPLVDRRTGLPVKRGEPKLAHVTHLGVEYTFDPTTGEFKPGVDAATGKPLPADRSKIPVVEDGLSVEPNVALTNRRTVTNEQRQQRNEDRRFGLSKDEFQYRKDNPPQGRAPKAPKMTPVAVSAKYGALKKELDDVVAETKKGGYLPGSKEYEAQKAKYNKKVQNFVETYPDYYELGEGGGFNWARPRSQGVGASGSTGQGQGRPSPQTHNLSRSILRGKGKTDAEIEAYAKQHGYTVVD